MELALVLVMGGLCGVSILNLVGAWKLVKNSETLLNRSQLQINDCFATLVNLKELVRDLRHDLVPVRLLPETILNRLTEALKNDVNTLKVLIASSRPPQDELYQKALKITYAEKHITTTILRRQLGIGYKRSVKLLERLLEERVIARNGKPGNYLPVESNPGDKFLSPN